jgi:ubiquinone/menaquinone biosynthesis C-methylase UbiE
MNKNQTLMGDPKKFNKYKRYGGYHWRWYENKDKYKRHVDFLKGWVKEKDVIDIGAGDGLITYILGIRGVDNDADAIRLAARRSVKIELGDAYDLPYQDNEFDSALMSDTIEHFSDTKKALLEARRVIKYFFYVNIPAVEKFVEPDHYRGWSADQFIQEVEACEFKLVDGPYVKHSLNNIYFKFQKI